MGEAKPDKQDTTIIAETARPLPHMLRSRHNETRIALGGRRYDHLHVMIRDGSLCRSRARQIAVPVSAAA